jgi:hypothetical protein
MSAYGWTDEQLESFQKAIKERLDRLTLHPHQRLGIPPMIKGQDIAVNRFSTEQTAELLKRKKVN